jgi:hypothetical protein
LSLNQYSRKRYEVDVMNGCMKQIVSHKFTISLEYNKVLKVKVTIGAVKEILGENQIIWSTR